MEDISEKKPLKRKAPASGAERNRKYRKKLKDDPKKAEEAKKKDRERKNIEYCIACKLLYDYE